jgi:hypothetical protein
MGKHCLSVGVSLAAMRHVPTEGETVVQAPFFVGCLCNETAAKSFECHKPIILDSEIRNDAAAEVSV